MARILLLYKAKKMNLLLKNFLLPSKLGSVRRNFKRFLLIFYLSFGIDSKSQITNYINNGSFENVYDCTTFFLSKAKYWMSVDSISNAGGLMSYCNNLVPLNANTYQLPRSGQTYILTNWFWLNTNRWYLKNRMRSNLHAGKTYCVKFYVNIANTSPRGMDGFGIYFGDSTIDTISKHTIPLTYLNPQVKNPIGNVVIDTLNWVSVTGTFVASGNEKYALLGNFLADNAVTTSSIGGPNYPQDWTDVCIDDVSCIELNLPAFAGRDTSVAPGSTVFIGRQPDVGIDEACVWYKLPGTVPIDTVAGFWVNPTTTSTYVVVQTICGLMKSDTVVIHMNLLDINNNRFRNSAWQVYPVPANDYLELRVSNPEEFTNYTKYGMYNQLGQFVKEEEISIMAESTLISTGDLPVGVYSLTLKNADSETLVKRFVILR